MLKTNCIDRTTLDLKVHLHVDVDRSSMLKGTFAAKQIRYKPAKNDKLRASAIVVYDANKSAFG